MYSLYTRAIADPAQWFTDHYSGAIHAQQVFDYFKLRGDDVKACVRHLRHRIAQKAQAGNNNLQDHADNWWEGRKCEMQELPCALPENRYRSRAYTFMGAHCAHGTMLSSPLANHEFMAFRDQTEVENFSDEDPLTHDAGWSIRSLNSVNNDVFHNHEALQGVWRNLREIPGQPLFLDKPHQDETKLVHKTARMDLNHEEGTSLQDGIRFDNQRTGLGGPDLATEEPEIANLLHAVGKHLHRLVSLVMPRGFRARRSFDGYRDYIPDHASPVSCLELGLKDLGNNPSIQTTKARHTALCSQWKPKPSCSC